MYTDMYRTLHVCIIWVQFFININCTRITVSTVGALSNSTKFMQGWRQMEIVTK